MMPDPEDAAIPSPSGIKPTEAAERIDLIDILRGFAVFGILVVNMASYSGMEGGYATWSQPLDRAIFLLTRFLFEAKFYSLFSFLFGWGMAVQMRRAEHRGAAFLPFYLRRLVALLFFGVIHATLIWTGDILTLYALLGFLLLLFRKRSIRFLLVASGVALVLAVLLILPWGPIATFRSGYFDLTSPLMLNRYASQLFAKGSFLEITRLRIQDFLGTSVYSFFALGNVFAMFLLGLAAGKAQFFAHLTPRLAGMRRALGPVLAVALFLNGLFVYTLIRPEAFPGDYLTAIRVAVRTFGAPLLMISYVAVIALLNLNPGWHRRLANLAPVGRMALSNYIFQSIVSTLIFYNYGIGLYGRFDPTGALVLTLLLYAAQVRMSEWWLERFRFGPLEWFWRTLTYGEVPILRRIYPFEKRRLPGSGASSMRRSTLALTLLSGALLAWGAGLFVWDRSLEREQVDPDEFYAAIRPAEVASSDVQAETGEAAAGNGAPDARLDIPRTVYRTPGSLVASGDIKELAEAFDTRQALNRVEALAGSEFAGRQAGSPGGFAAGEYLANAFESLGLFPAGEQGSYFQPFEIPYVQIRDVPRLAVRRTESQGMQSFLFNRDFTVISRGYAGAGQIEAPIIWVDRCTREEFMAVDIVDEIAFCRQAANVDAAHNALEFGARGLLLLIEEHDRPLDFGSPRFPAQVPDPIPVAAVGQQVAEAILDGAALQWQDLELGAPPQALGATAQLSVDFQSQEACPGEVCLGRNVLGFLPGRDPDYADQVVIISAHYDHMGSTPDGTVWWGANDDASGVAVLLEIARVWQQEGYVPRRSVLFAAWDAEELGLLGSKAFVANPTLPRESLYTDLQLDMVGAGGQQLEISGRGRLMPILEGVAADYGIETVRSESGGSDHASFLDAGLDAAVLTWQDPEGMYGDYHRPLDSPGRLDPVLLERAGFVAHLGLLSVVEGEPLIQELLDQRGQALLDGDLQAFLATGDPEQAGGEEAWFDSAREPQLHEAAFDLLSLYPREGTLRGVVQVTLVYPMEGDEERTRRVSEGVAVQFQRVDGSWRWMGPDLVEWSMDTADGTIAQSADALGVRVFAPPGTAVDAAAIEPALASLREASQTLGMRIPAKLRIEFYASAGDIGLFSDPGAGRDLANWMGPNVLRLLATSSTTSSENLAPAFLQWLLAANGIHREQAAWLWNGLALGLQVQLSPERYHPALLPDLYWSLLDGSDPEPRTAAWAAVEFIHQRYGWGGLGRSIRTLGMRCASLDCASSEGLNAAYEAALGMTLDEFEAAWQGYWRNRLETIVNRLQATLDKRSAAIRSGSSSQFLATVDPSVPNLVADQRGYFERVRSGTLSDLDWGVEVRTIFDDGRILARVGRVSGSSTTPRRPTTNWTEVLFTPSASGLRWADYPLQRLVASRVTVLYPEGSELLAEQLLTLLQEMRTALASALGLNPSGSITLKIYPSVNALINSVPLERSEDLPAILSTPGGSLRMALTNEGSQTVEDLRSAMIESMTRSLLLESGLDREWLLRGLSLYVAPEIDQRARMFRATQFLARIASSDQRGTLPALTGMPVDTSLDQESRELTAAQAWDAVHFLVDLYGEDVIGKILARIHAGDDFEQAFLAVTQHSEQEFAENWLDSILHAHLTAEQIELSESFDPAGAMAYVEELTGSAYRGRAAGTEGANAAAETIRDWFEQLGLQPAVVLEPAELPGMTGGQEAGNDNQNGDAAIDAPAGTGYEQLFEIFRVPLARSPALMVSRLDSAEVFSLRYRYDFLSMPQAYSYAGPVAGELIWLRVDETYPDVDLTGKIVLRFNPGPVEEEINAAIEKGAAGLILVTEDEARYPFLSKAPPYGREPARFDIPVFEIRRGAYQQLVLAAGQNPVSLQEGPAIVRFGMQAEMDLPTLPAERVETANVLGYIPGADPDLADEVVILGAHYDHVGDDPDAWRCEPGVTPVREAIRLGLCRLEAGLRYSGANDDASGIAALLEIARIMKEAGYQPERSILFAAWGAQESGEIGSEFYLSHPFFPLQKTAAMIQLDSIAGGRGYYLEIHGTSEHDGMLLSLASQIEDLTSARLSLVRESITGPVEPSERALPWLSSTLTSQGMESDHLVFRSENVPSLLLTWRGSSEANEPDGEAFPVDPDRLAMAGRLAALLAMSIAR